MGSSYDILKGNPLSTKGLDEGFMGPTIFQFTYNQNLTTTDGRYSIPDHTTVNDAQSCSFTFSSSLLKDTRSYIDSLKGHISTDFKFWGAGFSSSVDYQDVHQSTVNDNTVFISSYSQCEAYGALINDAPFTKDFVAAVSTLPSSFNSSTREQYFFFIQNYGTHIATALIMGGCYGFRSEFTEEGFSDLSTTSINIKASAGYSGLIGISSSLVTEDQQKNGETFNAYRKNFILYQVGGTPSVSGSGAAYSDWAQSVKDDPLPLSYKLTELYKYFTSKNFPHDPNIDLKKESLHNATLQYCMEISSDKNLCQAEFGPKGKDLIGIVITSNYIDVFKSDDIHFSYPFPNDPNLRIVGGLLGTSNITKNTNFLIDARKAPPNLVTSPLKFLTRPDTTLVYRNLCPYGYSSVSDSFFDYPYGGPSYSMYYNASHSCIVDSCFEPCDKVSTSVPNVFLIGGGFPQLGNSGRLEIGSFWRDLLIEDQLHEDYEEDLFKCLKYDCLSVL